MSGDKSLVQVLESCPSSTSDVTPPAVLPTLLPSLVEIQRQLAFTCMHGQPKI